MQGLKAKHALDFAMMKHLEPTTDPTLRCYQLEHREHYQKLVSELPETLRHEWIAFVEDTARNCLQCTSESVVGTVLPDFDVVREAIVENQGQEAVGPATKIVVAFSFGANFPFCSLAFRYLGKVCPALREVDARFICLFPPEAAAPASSGGPVPTRIDAGARQAAHCGLRYPFPEKFRSLSQSIPWFPGHGKESAPEALTLPGTCVVSAEGHILDLHIPVDVTRRLPPPAILERLKQLNPQD